MPHQGEQLMSPVQPDRTREALRKLARSMRDVCDILAEIAAEEEEQQVEHGIRMLVRRALSRSG